MPRLTPDLPRLVFQDFPSRRGRRSLLVQTCPRLAQTHLYLRSKISRFVAAFAAYLPRLAFQEFPFRRGDRGLLAYTGVPGLPVPSWRPSRPTYPNLPRLALNLPGLEFQHFSSRRGRHGLLAQTCPDLPRRVFQDSLSRHGRRGLLVQACLLVQTCPRPCPHLPSVRSMISRPVAAVAAYLARLVCQDFLSRGGRLTGFRISATSCIMLRLTLLRLSHCKKTCVAFGTIVRL